MRRLLALGLVACSATPVPPSTPGVSGMVVDDSNVAIVGAHVQVCNETVCTLATSDAAGSFVVTVPAGTGYHVIAHAPSTDPRAMSAGLAIVGDVSRAVALTAPVVIPVVGPLTDITLDTPGAQGVAIAKADWPAFAPTNRTLLAMWALAPWATYESTRITIANHFGLAPGTTASVYAVDETTASLLPPKTATVSADGASLEGATIDRLTWVVVAVP